MKPGAQTYIKMIIAQYPSECSWLLGIEYESPAFNKFSIFICDSWPHEKSFSEMFRISKKDAIFELRNLT